MTSDHRISRIATLAKDPNGEMVLLFNSIAQGTDAQAAQSEFEHLLNQHDYVVVGTFDDSSPAWRQMVAHSAVGPLPDPYVSGWFATMSDLYHQTKNGGREHAEHQMRKIHEIRDFLIKVHNARRKQESLQAQSDDASNINPAQNRPKA